MLLARILLSWVGTDRSNPVIDALCRATDPVLIPCRDLLFSLLGLLGVDMSRFPIDFSPIIAFFVVDLIRQAAITLIIIAVG